MGQRVRNVFRVKTADMENPLLHFSSLPVSGHRAPNPDCIELDPALDLLAVCENCLSLPYVAYLDSGLPGSDQGRFSYLTADPFLVLRSKGRLVEFETRDGVQRLEGNPFVVLQELLDSFHVQPSPTLPAFPGGAIGYLAYELAHHLERLPHPETDDLSLPEMNIGFYDWLIARDHHKKRTWAVFAGFDSSGSIGAQQRLDKILAHLPKRDRRPTSPTDQVTDLKSNFTRSDYLEAVKVVKDYISKGDVYQVNLSQRFEASVNCQPWPLYLRLRQLSSAPFGAYLQYPQVVIQSASPEEFLRVRGSDVYTRPMKGTRPRGKTLSQDEELSQELLSSEKERAENLMIVDLLRNDLGKVCVPGTVAVPELFTVEEYPTVLQMVSAVQGRLRPGLDAVDALQACFPGGSVTGAPKIRAMEIISELESVERSVYCGALGYMGFDGSMLTCVPIRTVLFKGGKAYFQVGGGVVADSDPEAEFEETLHKAQGSLNALGIHG